MLVLTPVVKVVVIDGVTVNGVQFDVEGPIGKVVVELIDPTVKSPDPVVAI